MANRVDYAVSVTPIRTIDADNDEYLAHDVIEGDIRKTLGGSDSILTGASTITVSGFSEGAVAYGNCPASGKLAIAGTDNTAQDMLFIKHTGFQFSSSSALGSASTASNLLEVFVEHAEDQFTKICSIAPGGAIVLPSIPALGNNQSFHVGSSGSETIAVEFAAID